MKDKERHEVSVVQNIDIQFHKHPENDTSFALTVDLQSPLPSDTPKAVIAFIIMRAMQAHLNIEIPRLEKICGVVDGSVVAFVTKIPDTDHRLN